MEKRQRDIEEEEEEGEGKQASATKKETTNSINIWLEKVRVCVWGIFPLIRFYCMKKAANEKRNIYTHTHTFTVIKLNGWWGLAGLGWEPFKSLYFY